MGIAKKHTDVSLDTSLFCLKHPAWCWNHFSAVRRWESSCRNRHIRCVVRRNPSPLSGNMAWCCWPWCQGWGFWGLKVEPLAAGEFWSWDMRIGTNCVSRVVGYFICIRHGIVWHWELHDASWSCCRTCASPFYVCTIQAFTEWGFAIVQNVGTFNSWLEDTEGDSQMNLSQHHLASQYPVMAKRKSLTLNHLPWRNKSGQQNKSLSLVTHWRHPRWLRIRESCKLTQPFNTFYIISCEWNSPKA